MKPFLQFIREQGVVGFATGFILGGAVSDLVKALMNDIVNPLTGLMFGVVSGLKTASFDVWGATILWGDFVSVLINFVILAAIVYFVFKGLRLDKIDKKK